ncbi:uncharacterized protein RAG0_09606 [Rhynchosporium agropyri]|uniref:Uncharacterized protein n=1 Tax=Rhynchosporium agropyri TaxID=914238 RepID=A0A1E1KW64_9HELO|nr:uncharacterized protein RAG0_09606 [Rhynchosporium agropyri]
MAPATASMPLQQIQNRPRTRMVVPAIPLPYVQKRQQQEAARAKAKLEAATPPPVFEVLRSPTPPSPVVEEITPPIANGSSDGYVSEKTEEAVERASPSVPDAPSLPAVEKEAVVEESEVPSREEAPGKQAAYDIFSQSGSDLSRFAEETQETPKTTPSDGQSSASRSTYQMPPAFIPAQNQTNGHTTSAKNAFDGHHAMHNSHPSVGNVMFGGFPDSERSSPALQSFTNNPPRYEYPQHNVQSGYVPPHSQAQSNGFNPVNTYQMAPQFPPGFYPRPEHHDNHARRQMVSFGPADGYSPSATPGTADPRMNFDPSTPHSYHGSQSSVANDPDIPAFYSQYPTAVISNGSNGHIDQVRVYQAQPKVVAPHAVSSSPGMFAPPGLQSMDNYDGLLYYLQQQFADPTFADYTLELRYSDDRAEPVRIPGHNLLFARSLTLKNLMTTQARESNNDGQAIRTLLIESDDRFLCSDGFWMAAHRLYGAPLMEVSMHGGVNAESIGPPSARFDLALGYAAAGKLLEIPPVTARGIEVASQLLNWNTIEKAFDFALDGGLDAHWSAGPPGLRAAPHRAPTYSPMSNILIHHSLQFIISSFPAGFVLDPTVGEPTHNRRLPKVPQNGCKPRLSAIKFGDHPSEDNSRTVSKNPATATLSKLLINLPWDLLKYILDSPRLGNVQGWATTVLRQSTMLAVIEERERRRIKVRESSNVSNDDRKAHDKDWVVVGWMEKINKPSGKDSVPTLARTWVDFTLPSLD